MNFLVYILPVIIPISLSLLFMLITKSTPAIDAVTREIAPNNFFLKKMYIFKNSLLFNKRKILKLDQNIFAIVYTSRFLNCITIPYIDFFYNNIYIARATLSEDENFYYATDDKYAYFTLFLVSDNIKKMFDTGEDLENFLFKNRRVMIDCYEDIFTKFLAKHPTCNYLYSHTKIL